MNQRLCRDFDVLDFDRSENPPMICYGACACTEQGARETGGAARPTDGSCICQIQIRQTVPAARLDDEAAPVTSVSAEPAAGADAGRTRECGRGTVRRPGNGKSQPGKLGAKLSSDLVYFPNSPPNFTMQKEDFPSHQNTGKCMEY
jgi:hypothetical protein